MSIVVFDIETGPLPEEQLKAVYKPPKPDPKLLEAAGPFDPATVKYGVIKDEAKRAAKLEDSRQKWLENQARAHEKMRQDAEDAWAEFVDQAPLSALTGRILAIGYKHDTKAWIESGDEASILTGFWHGFNRCVTKHVSMIGHNIHEFDLPFIVHRCWLLGVAVPAGVQSNDRYWNGCFIDTMKKWALGKYRDFAGLDILARAFGVGGKPDDCDGALFHKLWLSGDTEQRAIAEKYLLNDLEMTWAVARKMGIA